MTSHNTRSDDFGISEASEIVDRAQSSDSPKVLASVETCPLCLQPAELEQDHDYSNDLCRGRICHSCNLIVGRFDRPIAHIQRILGYLWFWSSQHALGYGRSYTDYMREAVPNYKRGRRAPRKRAAA